MALFRDDTDYTHRQTGFARYRQLLFFYGFNWLRINLITTLGALPLAAGILLSILTSSLMLLIPLSLLGGMVLGPFLAGLVDGIMRGLRDAPNNWWVNYQKSWRQNWRGSLMPGAILGGFAGVYAFMAYVLSSARIAPTPGTLIITLVGAALILGINALYWPQLVLFDQRAVERLRNALLFAIRHSRRVLLAVLIQLVWIALVVLLLPWTLIVIPFMSFWFPIFLSQYLLYDDLNRDLNIEERFIPVEGDPWRRDSFEDLSQAAEEPAPLVSGARHWEALVKSIEENRGES